MWVTGRCSLGRANQSTASVRRNEGATEPHRIGRPGLSTAWENTNGKPPSHDGLAALVTGINPDVHRRVLPVDILGDPNLPGLRADSRAHRGRGGQRFVH